MWSISEVKERGLFFFKKNYWKTVLVALIISTFLGSSSASSFTSGFNTAYNENNNDLFDAHQFFEQFYEIITVFALLIAIIGVFVAVVGLFVGIFVLSPLEVGTSAYMYSTLYQPGKLITIFNGFKYNYWNNVKVMFFRSLYIFLWSLLFVIPGIVKSYEYRLVPYLLSECPDMSKDDILILSSQMMKGHKMHTFLLDLSFVGWGLLNIISCGIIGIFYSNPYIHMTNAAHYDKMKFLYNEKFTYYEN